MFNFSRKYKKELKISFLEHKKEFLLRIVLTILLFLFFFLCIFNNSKFLIKFIIKIKFYKKIEYFLNFPTEFFYSTLEASIITSFFFFYPIIIYQILIFFFIKFFKNYFYFFLILLTISYISFNLGIIFAHFILIPIILNFFLKYNEEITNSFWSLKYYVTYSYYIFLTTGILFQIPLFLILFKKFKFKYKKFNWKYFILIIVIISAIITPTTDFQTQIIFSLILLLLYIFGVLLSLLIV
uniref:Sec-independent protein translocase component TatC n=1 Tax=Nitzschia sp. PL3-2 TaxID=2083271 RepID=A0A2Z5Z9X6_9STRA|nr:Sec-independent protein translocase component TatC [Nitzschia sp. PL3-2]